MPKAFVTGHLGFVGRHITAELERRGWEVDGIDADRFGDGLLRWIRTQQLLGYPRKYDLVVHCAYRVGGRVGIDGLNTNFAENISLDAGLFTWAMKTKPGRVLYFSSSAAYPVWQQRRDFVESEWLCPAGAERLREVDINLDDLSTPDADYGWAKLTGERLAQRTRENGVPVTVVRPFSGYAEDQSLDYPFPAIVKRASEGDLTVWGPPGQTRDWIHIDDVVNGALAVVEAEYDGPVNLCTGRGVEMGDLARMVSDEAHLFDCFRFPGHQSNVTYDTSKPTGVFYRVGDPTLMNDFYTAKITLEEGINRALKAGPRPPGDVTDNS